MCSKSWKNIVRPKLATLLEKSCKARLSDCKESLLTNAKITPKVVLKSIVSDLLNNEVNMSHCMESRVFNKHVLSSYCLRKTSLLKIIITRLNWNLHIPTWKKILIIWYIFFLQWKSWIIWSESDTAIVEEKKLWILETPSLM